jgi:enterochelin esterase-like enzyme
LTPTETPYVCQQEQGQVTRHEAGDPNDPDQPPLTYTIYTPPCFAEIPDATYPVLYIIHGQSFGDDQWDRLGMDEAANRLITSGEAPPFLIVMPLEENTWPDPFETRFGFRMADELVPWIDQHYPTCTERSCRAIGGLSRGGGWAVHIGFTRWQLFGAIGAHSTPVFLSDPYRIPIWLEEITREQWPRIYVDIGDRDMYFKYASDFNDLLTRLDVPHEYNIFEGAHDEEYWSQHVEDYLRWYTSPWLEKFDSNSNNSP